MIGALILKNLRVLRPGWLAVSIVSALCYVMGLVLSFIATFGAPPGSVQFLSRASLPSVFVMSAVFSLFAACVVLPTIAGMAVATERQDRSADFEFMLPVSRRSRVLSKLGTSVGVGLLLLALHVLIYAGAYRVEIAMLAERYEHNAAMPGYYERITAETWVMWSRGLLAAVSGAACGFGVAWLLSTFIRSAAIATAIAIGVMLALALIYVIIPQMTQQYGMRGVSERDIFLKTLSSFSFVSLVLGVVGLGIGTVIGLRRRGA